MFEDEDFDLEIDWDAYASEMTECEQALAAIRSKQYAPFQRVIGLD